MNIRKPMTSLPSSLSLLSIAILMTVSGCYNNNEVKAFLQQSRSPVSGLEYKILPPDVISITSIQVPEINGFSSQVRPDGKINVPLIGEVFVANKTPKQVENEIKKAALKYYEEADASVQIASYNSRKFYVFGEVSRPGAIRWTGCDTLLDVLAAAQPTPLAWPERIIVIRPTTPDQGGYQCKSTKKYALLGINPDPKGPVNAGQAPMANADPNAAPDNKGPVPAPRKEDYAGAKRMTVNLMAMVQYGDMSNNILLQPNDIVYVQPNPFGYVAREFEKVWSPFRAIGDGLSDFRQTTGDLRWIRDGMPSDAGGQRATIIAR